MHRRGGHAPYQRARCERRDLPRLGELGHQLRHSTTQANCFSKSTKHLGQTHRASSSTVTQPASYGAWSETSAANSAEQNSQWSWSQSGPAGTHFAQANRRPERYFSWPWSRQSSCGAMFTIMSDQTGYAGLVVPLAPGRRTRVISRYACSCRAGPRSRGGGRPSRPLVPFSHLEALLRRRVAQTEKAEDGKLGAGKVNFLPGGYREVETMRRPQEVLL